MPSLSPEEIQLIKDSGIFDAAWYAEKYPDVGIVGLDPLEHFLRIGIYIKRNPCALFDCSYYISHFDGFTRPEIPLLDYLQEGWRQHRNPHPLFDLAWYLERNEDIVAAGIEPLAHFRFHGGFEARQPHPAFPTCRVLERCPWLREMQRNPLEYYLSKEWADDPCSNAAKFLEDLKLDETVFSSHGKIQKTDNVSPNTKKTDEACIPKIEFEPELKIPVSYQEKPSIDTAVKLIAFYLPQFHPFPENDAWWGKGFTEWTNVGKALPNFDGHYQPHCPIHLGYYDLRVQSVMEEQAALAKNYGIYGFNYYFYWFAGKTLMEEPLLAMLKNKKVNIPFCFTWANENWTRRWDGLENDILIGQKHSSEDSKAFINHLFKYFRDPRYITINGCPILIVYRPDIIPKLAETAELWRKEMQEAGFKGIYLIASQTFGTTSPEPFGFDASMEFPPHTALSGEIYHECCNLNPDFEGKVYCYNQVVKNAVIKKEPSYKLFQTLMLGWDNTARKQKKSHIFHNFSLSSYKKWLSNICYNAFSMNKYSPDEKIVFINAWNEWAEGTHLEPDQKYGYGCLHATRQVIEGFEKTKMEFCDTKAPARNFDIAVMAHVHYEDAWICLKQQLQNAFPKGFDLYCSVSNPKIAKQIKEAFPESYIRLFENRGRDILPFIKMLSKVRGLGYRYICKVHTKKSLYRKDGDDLRESLYNSLLGNPSNVGNILSMFSRDEKLGIACPDQFLLQHNDHNMTHDHVVVKEVSDILNIKFKYSVFPAGSMFWFRPEALNSLCVLDESIFPPEEGLADGTPAHAIERLFAIIAENAGFHTKRLNNN